LIKLSGHDFVEGGLVPEESARVARRLAEDGIDAIEMSAGSAASPEDKRPSRKGISEEDDEAYLADIAALVKDAVTVPVTTVGGIRSLPTIDRILRERKADYVAMSRPFIREPHLIKRWKTGDTARAYCVSCNGCFETGLKGLGISCKVEREKSKRKD
jgi:2,4-dienoyl-CoA reductase-like NADH-dependent reductase (Old Yellow Enzyme family)